MVICLMYIGAVVLLHIFSKVKGGSKPVVQDPAQEGDM